MARYRFDDGKSREVGRSGHTSKQAELNLRDALKEIKRESKGETNARTTIAVLAEAWLDSKRRTLKASSIRNYEIVTRAYIVPRIGDLAIHEITTERTQRVLDGISTDHGPGAATSAKKVLSGMLTYAAQMGATESNSARLTTLRSERKSTKANTGATPIPVEDLAVILRKVRADERMHVLDMVDLVSFVAASGCRIGEACALTFDRVDLEAGTVTLSDAKTEAGDRTIRLDVETMGMLGDRRMRLPASPHNLVFPSPKNAKRDASNTANQWRAFRERAGLPEGYSFHSFRKTVATVLDQAGLSARDIAEFLGHKDPSITMRVYMSKVVGGDRASAALTAARGANENAA